MATSIRVHFRPVFYADDVEGWLCYDTWEDGKPTVKAIVGFETVDYQEGDQITPMGSKPGVYRLADFVQSVVDAAWAVGIKPTALKAELEKPAMMRHLEDMRALAFHKIGADKP
jgi:hypothetical protein